MRHLDPALKKEIVDEAVDEAVRDAVELSLEMMLSQVQLAIASCGRMAGGVAALRQLELKLQSKLEDIREH